MHSQIYENARQARDPRFDGRFFVGVRTTGVYCRPVCPVKLPRPENVVFFPTAAAAAEAGFRPCLRCRPEASPGTPAWSGTSATVSRALRLIEEGALDAAGMAAFCERLGVTSRHLGRLFARHVGASPKAVAQTRRLHFAKKLLDETDLPMAEIAFSAGYGSVRRFNDHFRQVYGNAPSLLRRTPRNMSSNLAIRLPYRPPYDYEGLLDFLAVRATPGVESVRNGEYARTIEVDGKPGRFRVNHDPDNRELVCRIDMADARSLIKVVNGIKRIFDLDADPLEINCALKREPLLGTLVSGNPGQRVPGTWDGFEVAVRAVVGQQISVKGATTVMGRIVERIGKRLDGDYLFPAPEDVATMSIDVLPMPRARALAIKTLAQSVVEGRTNLDPTNSTEALVQQLVSLKGIGLWTAQYITMRALNDPDAFLHNDLLIKRAAKQHLNVQSEKDLLAYAEQWRPWRAYACMHLWRGMIRKGER